MKIQIRIDVLPLELAEHLSFYGEDLAILCVQSDSIRTFKKSWKETHKGHKIRKATNKIRVLLLTILEVATEQLGYSKKADIIKNAYLAVDFSYATSLSAIDRYTLLRTHILRVNNLIMCFS